MLGRGLELAFQHPAWRLLDGPIVHVEVAGDPGDFGPPGQLGDTVRIGPGEHVRVGRRHVQVGGEAGEPGPLGLHLVDGCGRHQLRTLNPRKSVKLIRK